MKNEKKNNSEIESNRIGKIQMRKKRIQRSKKVGIYYENARRVRCSELRPSEKIISPDR